MGLYDNVTCEHELPDGAPVPHSGFQTKSMEYPYLDHYRITADGHLEIIRCDHVEDGVYPDDHPIFRGLPRTKSINERWERIPDFRGEIRFYDCIDDTWHEYSALFDKGKLLSIETVPES